MKLSGNELAAQIRASVKQRVANLPSPLTLAVMLVGDDPASKLYVSIKGELVRKSESFSNSQHSAPKHLKPFYLIESHNGITTHQSQEY